MAAVKKGRLDGGFDFDTGEGRVLEYVPDGETPKPRKGRDKAHDDLMLKRSRELTNLRATVFYCELWAERLLNEGHEITKSLSEVKDKIDEYKAGMK